MKTNNIYISNKEEICLFCPFCSKKTLHQCSTDFNLMSCSNCENTFAMIDEKPYNNMIEKIKKLNKNGLEKKNRN